VFVLKISLKRIQVIAELLFLSGKVTIGLDKFCHIRIKGNCYEKICGTRAYSLLAFWFIWLFQLSLMGS
tara:strand:+ start:447 stop:653 length:207 start_codon:yes stop_codon:yes gene_type:complete